MKRLSSSLLRFFGAALIIGICLMGIGYGISEQNSFELSDIIRWHVVNNNDYQEMSISNVMNINVNTNSRVIFQKGSSLKVRYTDDNLKLVDDGMTLTISDTTVNRFNFMFNNVVGNTVVIEYPDDYYFNNISINVDATSIEIEDLMALNLTIDNDAASTVINDSTITSIDFDSDVGSTIIRDVEFSSLNGVMDVGSCQIYLVDDVINYTVNLNGDVASIQIDGNNVGDFSQIGATEKTIAIQSDVGNIQIYSK